MNFTKKCSPFQYTPLGGAGGLNYNFSTIETQEIRPGFFAKMVHTPNCTFALWDIKQGCELMEHSHFQEQVTRMLSGQLQLTIAGVTKVYKAGDIVVIPGNMPHGGIALTDVACEDIWTPCREDYKASNQ